uniref:C-type lectin domain-containing protein n=1 Tax=Amphiprion ocellaris TaxID=80972 RepID=A0AAQ5YAV7_AMPOC
MNCLLVVDINSVLSCVFLQAQHFGWVHFSDSVYYVSSTMKNWQESRDDCIQKGADLVIINSREEQNFVVQLQKNLWIGLTDATREGVWKWVDGTPPNMSYWSTHEPNGATNENCVEVNNFYQEKSWNDVACSSQHYWICEKKVSP